MVKIYFEPISFILNFDSPNFLPFQLIGTILYLIFLHSIFNGNSKKMLKFSDTKGYNFNRVDFLYSLNAFVKSLNLEKKISLIKLFANLFKKNFNIG